jgi:hypothetical protein
MDESDFDSSDDMGLRQTSLKRSLLFNRRDNHGCDRVIKSCGVNGECCDVHDACYKKNKCTAKSWTHPCESINSIIHYPVFDFFLGGKCLRCNLEVMACIVRKNPGKHSCCSEKNCGTART